MEEMQRKLAEENDFLREEYFKMIDKIKECYYQGDLILSPVTLEKLLIFLDPSKICKIASYEKQLGEDVMKMEDKRKNRLQYNLKYQNKLKQEQIKLKQEQKLRGKMVKLKPSGEGKKMTKGDRSKRSGDKMNVQEEEEDIGFSDTDQSGLHKYTNSEDMSEDPRTMNTRTESGRGLTKTMKKKDKKADRGKNRLIAINISQLENDFSLENF